MAAMSFFVSDTVSRLSTSVGYQGDKPLRHPTLATDKPTHSTPIARYHCALRLITTSKVPRLRLIASLSTALRKRIKSASLHRVSGQQAAQTPDRFPLCQTQCSTSRSVTPYGSAKAHSMLQSPCAPLPLPRAQCSRCARGFSLGRAYPKSFHYARRTQCLSPPNRHSPTSPNHKNKS